MRMSLLLVYSLMTANNKSSIEADIISSKLNAFGEVRQLSIIYNGDTEDRVNKILENMDVPVLLNVRQQPSKKQRLVGGDPNSIILVMDETKSAGNILNSTLRNHETIYVFTLNSLDGVESELKKYWNLEVINAFALVLNDTEGKLYSFEPTPDGIEVTDRVLLENVDVFNGHGLLIRTSVVNLQPAAILQEKATDIDGYEGRMILEVTRKFNVTVEFALPRDGETWGWFDPAPAGAIGELFTGYSSFVIGDLAMTSIRTNHIDQFGGYSFTECGTWVVPKGAGDALPQWVAMLITEYTLDAWIYIIVSSVTVIIVFTVIDDGGFVKILFKTFAVSIGAPIHLPVKSSTRILMTVWVWGCFILAVAYQASMGSKLAVPPVKPDINTFDDLLESDLNITGAPTPLNLLSTEYPATRALKLRAIPTTENISTLRERVSQHRNTAYLTQLRNFRYNGILDPSSIEKLHLIEECAIVYVPCIGMTRWSPYYQGTRKTVQWLMESGISSKWEEDLMAEAPTPSSPPSPLDLSHLLGAFAILVFGFAISAVVFLVEMIAGTINMSKR